MHGPHFVADAQNNNQKEILAADNKLLAAHPDMTLKSAKLVELDTESCGQNAMSTF